eukprot:Gb_25873 [translate_table: standard]
MNTSTSSSFLRFCDEEDISCFEESTSFTTADFQLAAYKALLASLLSPCCHRPSYLSQGLALFRKGRQEAGTELAEFCAHALLALEPLIHPRSLPYAVPPATMPTSTAIDRQNQGNTVSHMQNAEGLPSVPGGSGSMTFGASLNDDIYQDYEFILGWLGNGEDSTADPHHLYDNTDVPIESLVETLTDNRALQCSPLDDITNMASQHSPINDEVQHSVAVEGLTSHINGQDIVTLPADQVETEKANPVDMCEASHLRADGSQECMVGGSGSEIVCRAGLSSSQSARELINDLTYEHPTTGRSDVVNNSGETMLDETATTVHMNTLAIKATETVHDPHCETSTSVKIDSQLVETISVPLTVKPFAVSSTAESDSDAIPDIVDGDPDTE